jgi:hypothetical protein
MKDSSAYNIPEISDEQPNGQNLTFSFSLYILLSPHTPYFFCGFANTKKATIPYDTTYYSYTTMDSQ